MEINRLIKVQQGATWSFLDQIHSSDIDNNEDPKISINRKFLWILLGEGVESFCLEKDILNFRFFFQDFIL